jgi:hypothetical protein
VIDGSGKRILLKIRRLKCEKCRRIHHELPDLVVPYKRHGAETIEKIIEGETESVPCSDDVILRIRRWWGKVSIYFKAVLRSIEMKLGVEYGPAPSMREMIRASVNSNNWVMAGAI